jgi:hypothetical protein
MKQLVVICCFCEQVRDCNSETGLECWTSYQAYQMAHGISLDDVLFSHGYCPECFRQVRQVFRRGVAASNNQVVSHAVSSPETLRASLPPAVAGRPSAGG